MEALGRGLLKEFPNPERAGCPGPDVLKRIASHEMSLAEAEKWLDHLTSCSPCYSDFSQVRATYQRRRARAILAIAASILIVACLAAWGLFLRQQEPLMAQTAVLDLRNRSVPRGTEPNSDEPPIEVSRLATHWNIYLPLGSSEGLYEIRLLTSVGGTILETSGSAKFNDHVIVLPVTVKVALLSPGKYELQVQKEGARRSSYPLVVR